MKTLRELEAQFITYAKQQIDGVEEDVLIPVQSLNDAQGIMFLCPLCFTKNNGPIGTHSVHVSFEGKNVPIESGSKNDQGQPSRWTIMGGAGLDDLQLSPSIFLNTSPCGWHGFIGNSGVPAGCAQ